MQTSRLGLPFWSSNKLEYWQYYDHLNTDICEFHLTLDNRAYAEYCVKWVVMTENLIFLGLHFTIAKRMYKFRHVEKVLFMNPFFPVYANCLLATSVIVFALLAP
jgi:hypothetical protein